MADDKKRELMHQSTLLQWEKMYDAALHSDRLAGEIGIFVMKTMIVANAGALVSLIAAYPHLARVEEFAVALPNAGAAFLLGLIVSMLAAAVAYFYQSFVTAKDWHEMHKTFPTADEPPPFKWAAKSSRWAIGVCMVLLFWSFG